jgi:GNAT superfamily N-acetyltransferase
VAGDRAARREATDLITVEPLRPELDEVAARLFSDAFLDDPAFVAIGPSDPRRRWAAILRLNRAALKVARRWGGPVHAAMEDGRLLAASVMFDEGRWPPPRRSFLYQLGFVLAGPGPVARGLPMAQLMERKHLKAPHLYLEILAAHPLQQRRGAGRALVTRLIEDADRRGLPAYLETTKAENVPYYRSFGFEVMSDAPLPRDARMWFMQREPRSDA